MGHPEEWMPTQLLLTGLKIALLGNLSPSFLGCKITPQEAHLSLFWIFFLCLCPLPALHHFPPSPPPDFLTANFLSFFHKFCCLFSSLCVAVLSYQTTSEIALPFLWDCLQVSLLTFIPSSFLPSPSDSRLFFHLEKKCQIDTVEDLKPGMSLTWLSCLLVKLQSFLC